MRQIERIEKYFSLIEKYPHITANVNELKVITDKDMVYAEQEKLYRIANAKNHPKHWYDLGVVAEDAWVVILRDLVKFPDGRYGGYIRTINRKSQLEQSGKDVVILVQIEDKFLLQKHFRHDDRMWHWECPRGFGEQNLSPKENAIKEITEETGLKVCDIQQLDKNSERVAYFIAECSGNIVNSDRTENISKTILVDKNQFENMIADCEIDDMYTIRAYLLYKLKQDLFE